MLAEFCRSVYGNFRPEAYAGGAYSPSGGSGWELAWLAIPGGSFASSPAATISPNGQQVDVAGIGNDLHVWRNLSINSGVAWSLGWKQVPGSIAF